MCNFFQLKHFKHSLLLALLMLLAIFCCASDAADDLTNECSDDSWTLYKSEFNKQYSSSAEDARRRSIFCTNIHMIYAHNERYKRGEVTYEMGVNQFADLSRDEFRRWLHGGSIGGGGGGVVVIKY